MQGTNRHNKIALVLFVFLSLIIIQPAWSQDNGWLTRPIQLGTSGGNINDMSKLYCCSGTLGALVQDADNVQYILSNNHVLARTNRGQFGEDIIQPGLIDQNPGCYKDSGDAVADLSDFVTISFRKSAKNQVDAAIARVRSGAVGTAGEILGIGQVSSATTAPALYMPVQKTGRTTGHTTGTVTGINATVKVTYNKTCGIGSQTATFTNQILIGPAGFSAGGDSGSLIADGCSPYPRAVGLLFAGSSTVTVANPITTVLSSLDVSMAGASGYCSSKLSGGSAAMTAQLQLPSQANQKAVEAANKVKERNEEAVLHIEGVVGMGIGLSETVPARVVLQIYVKRPAHEMRRVVPEVLEDIPVEIVETGEIIAY